MSTIKAGEKAVHIYKFKNTGKEPLIISDAKGSCGCTVPQWPKEPIAPGKGDKVEFDSGKNGHTQHDTVQIPTIRAILTRKIEVITWSAIKIDVRLILPILICICGAKLKPIPQQWFHSFKRDFF